MKLLNTFLLGLTLISTGTVAFAHDPYERDRNNNQGGWRDDDDRDNQRGWRNGDYDRNNSAYEQGYRQGVWDARNGRSSSNPWRNGRNHGQWQAGYNRGF